MAYTCNGLLLGEELKVKVIMWLNFEKKYHSKWKKPSRKDHILYCSTYKNVQNRQIYGDREQISGSPEMGMG